MDKVQLGITKQYNLWVNFYIVLLMLMNLSVLFTGVWMYITLFPLYGNGVYLLLSYYLGFYKVVVIFYFMLVFTFVIKYHWFRVKRRGQG